jgi:hypothetical protein
MTNLQVLLEQVEEKERLPLVRTQGIAINKKMEDQTTAN